MTKQKVAPFYANCVDCAQEGVRTETNLTWVGTFLCELHKMDREAIFQDCEGCYHEEYGGTPRKGPRLCAMHNRIRKETL